MKKLSTAFITLLLSLSPALALAVTTDVGVSAGAGAAAQTNSASVSAGADTGASGGASSSGNATAGKSSPLLAPAVVRGKERGGLEIDRRTTNLNDLTANISAMKNLSDSDKAAIEGAVSAQVNALAALKTKIAADTDAATLKTDVKSITDSYRVYALLLPQIRIIAAADRIVSVTRQMQEFSAKLQARISAAQSSGADVTAAANAFTDFNAKVADAQTQAQAAVTAVAALTPDQGDAAKLATNTKVLSDARAKIVLGQKDLRAAYQDANVIIKAVKGKPEKASATTNASATTSAGTSH